MDWTYTPSVFASPNQKSVVAMPVTSKPLAGTDLKTISKARRAARDRFNHYRDDDGARAGPIDPENPPLSDEQLAELRPAHEVHPELLLIRLRRKGGRPKSAAVKKAISIRLDLTLIEALKAQGSGWQTHLNDSLAVLQSLAASGQDSAPKNIESETDDEFMMRLKSTRGIPTVEEVDRFRRIERERSRSDASSSREVSHLAEK